MSDIPVSENPKFSQVMEALTTQTPAHADVFNAIFSQFLNNDYYLSLLVERLSEKLAGHFADYVAHITADERTSWNNTLDNAKEYSDGAYQQATGYTDLKISQLINGAPETLDTLKEVADAIKENETVVDALDAAIGTKASKAEFDTHADNSTIHITATERTNWNSKASGSHTHNYAGSTSAGGAATSAVKLQTARNVKIGNETHTFNGASDITFTAENMGLAPQSHASAAKTYGIGNSSNYGHVQVSDNYMTSGGNAADGVAASSEALANVYKETVKKTTLKTVGTKIQIAITPPCLIILTLTSSTWAELIVKSGYKATIGSAPSSSLMSTTISGNTYTITLNTTAYGEVTYGVINL